MAANNYFGFTHGGTQYRASSIVLSAQPTSAYPTAQTAYVQPTHQTAYAAAAPRAVQTYDSYQTTPAPGQYAYATRTQPTATYDTTKAYYAPQAAAPTGTATAVYTVAETPYQTAFTPAAKPVYSSPSYTTAAAQPRQTATAKTQNTAPASTTNYVYQSATTTAPASSTYATTTAANSYSAGNGGVTSGYDAALYSAATTYYQQQQAAKTGTTWQYKKGAPAKPKQKQPPKQPQLHYCEVCKISCAGPQTYREHLEGQKHKKKEAALKTGGTAATGRGQNQLRCELCDVSCTGADAYAAHIRGAKHQKVLKLHTKLGKPIPSTDPVVVSTNSATTTTAPSKAAITTSVTAKPITKPVATVSQPAAPPKKIMATPKITFIGGSTLKTTGVKTDDNKSHEQKQAELAAQILLEDKEDAKMALVSGEKDVMPVGERCGQEYIEEVKNEAGKTVSFNCKLCECKFNDPNAKEMHMKGRRHRLQYKKKVDPSLQVEVKPSIRARKLQEEKLRRQAAKEDYWRRRDAEERWREEMRMEEEQYYMGRGFAGRGGMPPFALGMSGPGGPGPMGGMPVRRPDTSDDRHVMAKHASIYPNETELQAVQNIVSSCEKALKLVSDFIADIDAPKPSESEKVKEEEKKTETEEGEKKDEPPAPPRALKGVMRVGVLAKGLLLHNDLNVQLVLLCSEKPTRTQLERIADSLPKHLAVVSEDTFDVKISVEEAAVVVTSEKEPKTTCSITLTSPVMREENEMTGESVTVKDPPDVLDRQKCLDALAALRHAKWFQARANGLQSCVVVIRILRDLCQRVPTWTPLNQWAMELLVEKCVSSGGANMSPGDALRRVFECIASGILLPGKIDVLRGPGLYDPCEKNPKDAATSLSNQEREDITASAQHALRLIAFRQIHKVLGMDPLPLPRFRAGHRLNSRKRRRTNSTGDAGDGEGVDGKKDKKDDGTAVDPAESQ